MRLLSCLTNQIINQVPEEAPVKAPEPSADKKQIGISLLNTLQLERMLAEAADEDADEDRRVVETGEAEAAGAVVQAAGVGEEIGGQARHKHIEESVVFNSIKAEQT